jgi:hypothetical protein
MNWKLPPPTELARVRSMGGTALEQRVRRVAETTLAEQRYVSAIDVFLGLGWLTPLHLDEWRRGRVQCLERVVQASLPKLSTAMRVFRRWAQGRGLVPSETGYVARTRDRRPLRFSVSGATEIERAYRTHWVSPELSAAKRERRVERRSRLPDVVLSPLEDWTCTTPQGTGRSQAIDQLRTIRRRAHLGSDAHAAEELVREDRE